MQTDAVTDDMPDEEKRAPFDPVEAVGSLAAFERLACALAYASDVGGPRACAAGLWGASAGLLIAALLPRGTR